MSWGHIRLGKGPGIVKGLHTWLSWDKVALQLSQLLSTSREEMVAQEKAFLEEVCLPAASEAMAADTKCKARKWCCWV